MLKAVKEYKKFLHFNMISVATERQWHIIRALTNNFEDGDHIE